MPTCVLEATLNGNDIQGLLQWLQDALEDPILSGIIMSFVKEYLPNVTVEEIQELIPVILSLWCNDQDKLGGRSVRFYFDDNVTPICQVR